MHHCTGLSDLARHLPCSDQSSWTTWLRSFICISNRVISVFRLSSRVSNLKVFDAEINSSPKHSIEHCTRIGSSSCVTQYRNLLKRIITVVVLPLPNQPTDRGRWKISTELELLCAERERDTIGMTIYVQFHVHSSTACRCVFCDKSLLLYFALDQIATPSKSTRHFQSTKHKESISCTAVL